MCVCEGPRAVGLRPVQAVAGACSICVGGSQQAGDRTGGVEKPEQATRGAMTCNALFRKLHDHGEIGR